MDKEKMFLMIQTAVLCFSVALASAPNGCPGVDSIFPPSGSPSVAYRLNGTNLLQLAAFRVLQDGQQFGGDQPLSPTSDDALWLSLQFLLVSPAVRPAGGQLAVVLVPADRTRCVLEQVWIDFRPYDPSAALIVPSAGQAGTLVRIGVGSYPPQDGDNSRHFTVEVGGIEAPFVSKGGRILVVRAPPGDTNAPVPIEIVSQYGNRFPLGQWTRLPQGNVSSLSPAEGQRGTLVTIHGEHLLGHPGLEEPAVNFSLSEVWLGRTPAQVVHSNESEVVVIAGSGPSGVGDVRVRTTQTIADRVSVYSGEGPSLVLPSAWTQLVDGEISAIVPPHAPVDSWVFLCGSRLLGGGNEVTDIHFGEVPSSNFTTVAFPSPWAPNASNECVVAAVPVAVPAGSLEVTITSDTMAVVKTHSEVLFSAAAITSLEPPAGQYGTVVNITGRHLSLGSSYSPIVTIAGTPAAIIAMDTSSDWSWITVAAGWPNDISVNLTGVVELTVSHLGEQFSLFSSPLTWTYLPDGTITGVAPDHGQVGSIVTITGENLLGYGETLTSVFIGNAKAVILNISNMEVVVEVPSANETGLMGVTILASSGAVIEADGIFEVREPGFITSVEPSSGQWGTTVVIEGSHLFAHADNITKVTFNGILATIDHSSSSNGTIHVRVGPCHCNETVAGQVAITSNSGAVVSSAVDAWAYHPAGHIQQVLPGEGENGTVVTILGWGLLGGGDELHTVHLNQVPAEVLSANDSTVVVRNGDLAGADSLQPDHVRIEATSGAIVVGGYFVQREHGVITGFYPTSGQEGTYVTVTGLAIANSTVVFQNASVAGVAVDRRHIQVISDSSVVLQVGGAPVGTSGGIELVREDGVTVNSRTSYNFVYRRAGEILGLSPEIGVEGDVVHIFGQFLIYEGSSIAMVSLAGSTVSRVVEASMEEIVVIAGAASTQNSSDKVVIESSDGSVTEGESFLYLHNFSLTVVQGPSAGQFGTQLTLGLPFLPSAATRAYVGHAPAQVVSTDTSSWTMQIAVPRPPDPHPNMVDIFVHDDASGRVARLSRGFQYLREGHILSVLPSVGQNGTRVVIQGLQLLGGGAAVKKVCLGGVQATVEHANDSEVTVKAGYSRTALVGDVEVVSDTGARVVLLEGWKFVTPASIQSVTPLSGQFGTRVEVRGVGLLSGGMEARRVVLNGAEVHSVESSEDTRIVVRVGKTPLHSSPMPDEGLASVVVVSDTDGTVVSHNSSLAFQYVAPGTVLSVTPSNGTGGTEVLIEGVRLLGDGTGVAEVYLAGVAVLNVFNVSNHSITVIAGFTESGEAISGGSVEIELDTGALVVLEDGWSYIAECPLGQFQNSSTQLCDDCHHLCTHCSGPGNSDCFECTSGSFWTRDTSSGLLTCVDACPLYSTVEHECVTACQAHQFGQHSLAGIVFCQDCSHQCDRRYGCKGPSASECVRCVNVSYQGECNEECPLGHYVEYSSRSCLPCHAQCEATYNCSGPSPADCHTCKHLSVENSSSPVPPTRHCVEECPTGYYQHQLHCLACHEYCHEGCVGPSPSQCTGCAAAALRYANGSTLCVPSCDSSLQYQDLDGVCQSCHHLCSAHGCKGPGAGDCWKCMEHSLLLDGVCVVVCPTGYFNSTGVCLPCDFSCTQGCSGQGAEDCFFPGVAPFASGTGTTTLTVVLVVGLAALVLVLGVLLVCLYCKRQRHYSLQKKVGRMLRPVSNTISSENSVKRKESLKVSLSRRSSILRRENFLGSGDPESINPLVHGEVLEHTDDHTLEQFRVAAALSPLGTGDRWSLRSDDVNPYQEIPMIELASASTDPERITVASQYSRNEETVRQLAEVGSDDGFTVRISFDSSDEADRGAGQRPPHSASQEPKEGGTARKSDTVRETPYYNLDDAVLTADRTRVGLQEHYDRPRKIKRRNLSASFINTAHYDAPTSQRAPFGTPPLLDRTTPTSLAASHPYATPSVTPRRKSVSGATLHHVQTAAPLPLPQPCPQPSSPSEHVYATVKKLGRSDSGAHYDTPSEVAAPLPAAHAPRKESGSGDPSSIKKLLGWWVKGEPRPYEVPTGIAPTSGASVGAGAPLPPIPVPSPELSQLDRDGAPCEVPSSPLSERIYEEAFCGFDDNFVLVSTVSTPPALPERRQTKPMPNQPASQPLTQDVEIIWTPPPAETQSDSDDSADMELPLSQQSP